MPAPGDQHSRISNPFAEERPRVSEYTAQEIATLQSRLERQLGPEYISSRSGPSGTKLHYVTAEKMIGLANEVFGFNGWSSSIQNIQIDFMDENPATQKFSLGLSVVMRVTLRDGTFHEDIGYGHIENCKGKASAFEKAKKEGTTDALKRALRNFGSVLGNCIYDKTYLANVTKIKVEPKRFDKAALHRHPDFAKQEAQEVKPEPRPESRIESEKLNSNSNLSLMSNLSDSLDDFLGELDEADFAITEGDGHPDEVALETSQQKTSSGGHTSGNDNGGSGSTNGGQFSRPPQQQNANSRPAQPPSRPLVGAGVGNAHRAPQTPHVQAGRPVPPNQAYPAGPRPQPHHTGTTSNNGDRPRQHQPGPGLGQHQRAGSNATAIQTPPAQAAPPPPQNGAGGNGSEPVAFFSARAVPRLADDGSVPQAGGGSAAVPLAGQLFNPRAESPSIRKTPGIDHSKSKPVARTGQHVPPASQRPSALNGNNNSNNANGASGGGSSQARPAQQDSPQLGRGNVVNPHLDQARRIGAPGGAGSPLANRGQYKPPTMAKRPPLADVPNGTTNNGRDVKRVKLG